MAAARLTSLDALRGAVMIVMALDHVRDFFHAGAMSFSPTDLTRTTTLLFFTRWITHFCAPVFAFAAGAGAYLWWQRSGRTRGDLARFLITRGLWLVLLEITVMRFGYQGWAGSERPVFLLVFWSLGLSMIALAALAWIPLRALAALSIAVIALHNLTDGAALGASWNFLHRQTATPVGGWTFISGYPLIPWIFVMSAGFCFGSILLMDEARRRKMLAGIGIALTAGFVVLRASNLYGDPAPWTSGVLSFLNTTKYPPSLVFLLMTLGPAILVLAWFDRFRFSDRNPLIVFGRVPLFYFVLHFYAAHLLTIVCAFVRYGGAASRFAFYPVPSMGGPRDLYPPDFGYSLAGTYLAWIVIVVALYPLCRWFAGVKARRRDWWLGYL